MSATRQKRRNPAGEYRHSLEPGTPSHNALQRIRRTTGLLMVASLGAR